MMVPSFSSIVAIIIAIGCLIQLCLASDIISKKKSDDVERVTIFHLIDNKLWGEIHGGGIEGTFPCPADPTTSKGRKDLVCEVVTTHHREQIVEDIQEKVKTFNREYETRIQNQQLLTVMLYNIHTWKAHSNPPYGPNAHLFPVNYTMVESEESMHRFHHLFHMSFKHYHGNSTTHPHATIQRSYFRGWKEIDFLPIPDVKSLEQAAAFVASTCHKGDSPSKRQHYVTELRHSFRVDGLGKCLHTANIPEERKLHYGRNEEETLQLKRRAIQHYMFYLAFENTKEPGYVTEKVFDALLAGVVPVYLGATEDCKRLLPHPKAAIFVSDFDYDMKKLGAYLQYLVTNTTAYEEHRAWRKNFDPNTSYIPDIIKKSWPCRICEWAKDRFDRSAAEV